MPKMKPLPKLILFVCLIAGLFFGYRHLAFIGVIPRPSILKTLVPLKAELQTAEVLGATSNVKAVSPPSTSVSTNVQGPQVRSLIWAWNSQLGLLFANGGPETTKGSLMEKRGVNVKLIRQDDTNQMQAELIKFATELKTNPQPSSGAHSVAIMGDGAAAFLKGLNDNLVKLGPEYQAIVVGSAGYSRGEDSFMASPELKQNPKAAKGMLVAGVLRDGDWNIAMIWAANNDIAVNPDDKVYDENAINWVNADTYVDAAQKYVSGYCVDLPIKNNPTKPKKHACVNGVVTWTPGDVTVAKGRGGLVRILSTKENAFQMPNTIIMIKKWATANRSIVENYLAAIFEGGDQIKANPAALPAASKIAAKVWNEQTPEYWEKYFKGVTERDKQGIPVELGGSSVNNLADNVQLFGLKPGSGNLFKATYETFGNIVVQQYPKMVPNYPPTKDILDTSFVENLMSRMPVSTGEKTTYTTEPMKEVVGDANWSILFQVGSDRIDPRSEVTLQRLMNQMLISKLVLVIHGHTDSTGDPTGNMQLSQKRAESVRNWLQSKSPDSFPAGRIRVIAHGQDDPLCNEKTPSCYAQNRRVQIVQGTIGN